MRIHLVAFATLFCLQPLAQATTVTNVTFSGLLFGTVNQTQAFESYFYLTMSGPTNTFPMSSPQPFSANVPVSVNLQLTVDGTSDNYALQQLVINSAASEVTSMDWYSGNSKVLGLISTIPSIINYSFNQPFQNTTAFGFGGSDIPLAVQTGFLTITGTQYVTMRVAITPEVTAPEPQAWALVLLGGAGLLVRRKLVSAVGIEPTT